MTTVFDFSATLAGTDDSNGNQNLNNRLIIPTSALSAASGNQCQIVLLFGSTAHTGGLCVNTMYFGQASVTAPNFNGDQVQVLFGGGATVTYSGVANSTVTSDIFTLPQAWDATKKYMLAWHYDAATQASTCLANPVGFDFWGAAGADSSSQTAPAGLGDNGAVLVFLEQIFITASASPTVLQTSSSGVYFTKKITTVAY